MTTESSTGKGNNTEGRCGGEMGRHEQADAEKLWTVKLNLPHIEAVVRGLICLIFRLWQLRHMNYPEGPLKQWEMWAERSLEFVKPMLGRRLDKIKREVGLEMIGTTVMNCGCFLCCGVRPLLYPALEKKLERSLKRPSWQAVVTEIRRLCPYLPEDRLLGMVKTAIKKGAPVRAREIARCIASRATFWESDRPRVEGLNEPEKEGVQNVGKASEILWDEWCKGTSVKA